MRVGSFIGTFEYDEFAKFTEYTQLTKGDLLQLKDLLSKADCEAIKIEKNRDLRVRYDGNSLYQYEYWIPHTQGKMPPKDYIRLDKNVYSGLYDSGLHCEIMIFEK